MSYDYESAYLKKLAKLLFIYGTDAEDIYLEEFEELKNNKEELAIVKRFYQELADSELA